MTSNEFSKLSSALDEFVSAFGKEYIEPINKWLSKIVSLIRKNLWPKLFNEEKKWQTAFSTEMDIAQKDYQEHPAKE